MRSGFIILAVCAAICSANSEGVFHMQLKRGIRRERHIVRGRSRFLSLRQQAQDGHGSRELEAVSESVPIYGDFRNLA